MLRQFIKVLGVIFMVLGICGGFKYLGQYFPFLNEINKDQITMMFGLIMFTMAVYLKWEE